MRRGAAAQQRVFFAAEVIRLDCKKDNGTALGRSSKPRISKRVDHQRHMWRMYQKQRSPGLSFRGEKRKKVKRTFTGTLSAS